jgi:hypothetical protein
MAAERLGHHLPDERGKGEAALRAGAETGQVCERRLGVELERHVDARVASS